MLLGTTRGGGGEGYAIGPSEVLIQRGLSNLGGPYWGPKPYMNLLEAELRHTQQRYLSSVPCISWELLVDGQGSLNACESLPTVLGLGFRVPKAEETRVGTCCHDDIEPILYEALAIPRAP